LIETVHIDGAPATVEGLTQSVVSNYAAFTSFQTEPGGVRGLDLHLDRLRRSALELFDQAVPEDDLRAWLRHALEGREARQSVRIQLLLPAISMRRADAKGRPSVLIRVSPPMGPIRGPLRLQSQAYEREAPHLKHAATFGLVRAIRQAKAANFDDALFVTRDGLISEGSIWNIGFINGQTIVWPRAPMLAGTGQALLERGLETVGLSSLTRGVALADIAAFDGAFICNSASPATPVSAIDDVRLPLDDRMIDRLEAAWTTNPVAPI
jgi:branched-subunit amino acid aminotransferase/4-amino-4-deoxychorismate lyase